VLEPKVRGTVSNVPSRTVGATLHASENSVISDCLAVREPCGIVFERQVSMTWRAMRACLYSLEQGVGAGPAKSVEAGAYTRSLFSST